MVEVLDLVVEPLRCALLHPVDVLHGALLHLMQVLDRRCGARHQVAENGADAAPAQATDAPAALARVIAIEAAPPVAEDILKGGLVRVRVRLRLRVLVRVRVRLRLRVLVRVTVRVRVRHP